MKFITRESLFLGLISPVLVSAGATLKNRQDEASTMAARAQEVKSAFRTSWEGYYNHAFPHDTLRPVSVSYEDDRNFWGVSAVDTLSTAIIMDDTKAVQAILDFIPTIDFSTTKNTQESISVFESSIRYLAGMISAYDLLKGPKKGLVTDPGKVDALLEQSKSLADSLSIAFGTKSGVPSSQIVLNPKPQRVESETTGPADAGTLVLEWTRLSDLTGDDKYAKLAQKAESYLVNPTGEPEPFPGLIGSTISLETGEILDQRGGWGGGIDSFYEYLIKMYLYDPQRFSHYKDRWVLAVDSSIEHLKSNPTTRKDLTFFGGYDGTTLVPSSGHLDSFVGGNLILGGILLQKQEYVDVGLELADSHYRTYRGTTSGIGPETFSWVDSANPGDAGPPEDQADMYEKSGFWVTSPYYVLRPETIESLYYAYRATGDSKWQDMAWEAFSRIKANCRAGVGFAGLNDVTKEGGGGSVDYMESFWMAETLKYLYLIFTPDAPFQVQKDKPNEFVFNTEAHPMRVRS